MESTITSKGQITLPKAMRDALNLETGDKLIFEELEDGRYAIIPKTLPASVLQGIVKYDGPPISIEQMNETIKDRSV